MGSKQKVSQNVLALRRYGKLFRDLDPESQQEIIYDMENEMLEGKAMVILTDRKLVEGSPDKAKAGGELYAEGSPGGTRNKGATLRKSKPHGHSEHGEHLPLEGKG